MIAVKTLTWGWIGDSRKGGTHRRNDVAAAGPKVTQSMSDSLIDINRVWCVWHGCLKFTCCSFGDLPYPSYLPHPWQGYGYCEGYKLRTCTRTRPNPWPYPCGFKNPCHTLVIFDDNKICVNRNKLDKCLKLSSPWCVDLLIIWYSITCQNNRGWLDILLL